jgi:hypothetical protein
MGMGIGWFMRVRWGVMGWQRGMGSCFMVVGKCSMKGSLWVMCVRGEGLSIVRAGVRCILGVGGMGGNGEKG